jgi:murein DD-endopeptidase MepM/ murein hydrolase activator NlpD
MEAARRHSSFGQTVCSPCDGRIAYIEDLHPDNESGEAAAEHPAGNYLTIEIAPERYVMIAHLKEKSLRVKPGDTVSSGQPIAQCGNSGNSSGPHVHLQVQTTPQFTYEGQTVPITFRDVLRREGYVENTQPKRNDLLVLPSEWKAPK